LIGTLLRFSLRQTKFLRQNGEAYQRQRLLVETMAKLLVGAPGVACQAAPACPCPAQWLIPAGEPSRRAILYLHGGAFTYGSSNTHRPLVSWLVRHAGVRALLIDYRLAPEHPFPAALEDCAAAYRWLLAQGTPAHQMTVAGDSAGGNLALALCHLLRQEGLPLPGKIVCISPACDLSQIGALTAEAVQQDPILVYANTCMVLNYIGDHDPAALLLSPALGDLAGFPRLLIHTGERELLLADAQRLYQRALAAGVPAQIKVWPGMWHVFQAYVPYLPEARQSVAEIGRFIAAH
jgi:acetyl esterase/lipase